LSYLAGFAARGDSIVLTLFLSLWVQQEALQQGDTPAQALAKGATVSGIAQTCALVFAPVAGLLCHSINRLVGLMIVAAIATVGYSLIFFLGISGTTASVGAVGYIGSCLIGMGEIGLIVCSTHLVSQEAHPTSRGSVSGFFALCGTIGILTGSKLGGYLFDSWQKGGPFLLFAGFNLLVIIAALFVWIFRHKRSLWNQYYSPSSLRDDPLLGE